MNKIDKDNTYNKLVDNIGNVYLEARDNAVKYVNVELVKAYWIIGNNIIEYEQKGSIKAEYGEKLIFRKPDIDGILNDPFSD